MEIINNRPLIYISGWKGSGKESSTYKWLEKYFSNLDCYHSGGQTDVSRMIKDMRQLIELNRQRYGVDPILIGNSFGGFVASLFTLTSVLINPALFPSETLPKIADLTDREIECFRLWERSRCQQPRSNVYAVCTTGDELISDHRIEAVCSNPAITIPGGAHRLTDEQRDQYLLPLIKTVALDEDFKSQA